MITPGKILPQAHDFLKIVKLVALDVRNGDVTAVFHGIRRLCPDWIVTPHMVRQAIAKLQRVEASPARKNASDPANCQVYPSDIVEFRVSAKGGKSRAPGFPCRRRGQVMRVAGVDDGIDYDDDEPEPPLGYCSVAWLGKNPTTSSLEECTSLKVLDRGLVLGDRVAKSSDAKSLGTVTKVSCTLVVLAVKGESNDQETPISQEVDAREMLPVGKFCRDDWVCSKCERAPRWIGRVNDAVYEIQVEMLSDKQPLKPGRLPKRTGGVVTFSVGTDGLPDLRPASVDQDLCPYYPGQRVQGPPKLWQEAEWLKSETKKPCSKSWRMGIVSNVECKMLSVRWIATAYTDPALRSQPPDEWVGVDSVWALTCCNNQEPWRLGQHLEAPKLWNADCLCLVGSRTKATVQWSDGTIEEDIPSVCLCPRPHASAHDFLPGTFVVKSEEYSQGHNFAPEVNAVTLNPTRSAPPAAQDDATNEDYANDTNQNNDYMYGEGGSPTGSYEGQPRYVVTENIISAETAPAGEPSSSSPWGRLGVIRSVDLKARTARVNWSDTWRYGSRPTEPPLRIAGTEEVSVFELQEPEIDIRLGDTAIAFDATDSRRWVGRVDAIREDGLVKILCGDGTSCWNPAWRLHIPDDHGSVEDDDDMDASVEGDEEDILEGSPDVDVAASEAEEELEEDDEPVPTPERSPLAFNAIPALDCLDEAVDSDDHAFAAQEAGGSRQLLAALRRDMKVLQKTLVDEEWSASASSTAPSGSMAPIIVRTYASRSDLFRAMVVGPPGTPYARVPFFFDFMLPPEYPNKPPKARFHSQYVGDERLNPNLYIDGKVCLSLLGTWSGPSWTPQVSTLLQVLLSLQGLVLTEEPYYNEPGHENDQGTEQGKEASALYNENARLLSLRAAINVAKRPPKGFEQVVASFFAVQGSQLLRETEQVASEEKASETSAGFRKVLSRSLLPQLRSLWGGRRGGGESSLLSL
eukprot:TRINITY_DN30093_c0_g1_i1.p1 TRINITY_DN30093_c0_g1~~TRINITY_DN30093_c0_g1_i1.p1  ORF type:complete len:972 (-),score=228.70 TRINITY_DN30093_c0_g1_i1:144-3059(-)